MFVTPPVPRGALRLRTLGYDRQGALWLAARTQKRWAILGCFAFDVWVTWFCPKFRVSETSTYYSGRSEGWQTLSPDQCWPWKRAGIIHPALPHDVRLNITSRLLSCVLTSSHALLTRRRCYFQVPRQSFILKLLVFRKSYFLDSGSIASRRQFIYYNQHIRIVQASRQV